MLKFLNFFLIIIFSILVAGIYGIIHDQITYSISNDYFTLFKFQQFGISKSPLNIRAKVAIIGFLATWWVGLFLGIVYALLSLFRNSKKFKNYIESCFHKYSYYNGFWYFGLYIRKMVYGN